MQTARSIPVVAAGLLLVVGVLLGGALLFLRRESASVGTIVHAPQAAPVAQSTVGAPTAAPNTTARAPLTQVTPTLPTATAIAATATGPAALATPGVATAVPQSEQVNPRAVGTLVFEVQVFDVNGTQVAILPGTPTPVIPWWQITRTSPEGHVQALLAAYLHFWDVRAQALLNLDPALPRQVMTGQPLAAELAAIEDFRARNQAQRVDVGHTITVLWADENEGAVLDTIADRSTMVDLDATPEPATPGPASPYRMAYRLRKNAGGSWQVVESVRIVR